MGITESYIRHNTYHILTVPSGKIAKIILNGDAFLLESRTEPYLFQSSRFELVPKDDVQLFHDATEKLIVHGSIKRVMPDTSDVAIAYDNGHLVVIGPRPDHKPTVINSPNYRVNPTFISTQLQTIVFPGEGQYEEATTLDGVKIKMKLMLTYRIHDVSRATEVLGNPESILAHVERCALTDMRNATQNNNYYAAQQTTSARVQNSQHVNPTTLNESPSAPQLLTIQDEIRQQLAKELRNIGVNLERLAFEEFNLADQKIREQFTDNAMKTAQITSKITNFEQQQLLQEQESRLKQSLANQNLTVKTIELNQQKIELENQTNNVRAAAEQKIISTKADVDSILTTAQAKAEAMKITALAEAERIKLLLLAQGEAYAQYPQLFQLEKLKIQAKAMKGIHTSIVSPEVARPMYGYGGLWDLPGKSSSPALTGVADLHDERNEEEHAVKEQPQEVIRGQTKI